MQSFFTTLFIVLIYFGFSSAQCLPNGITFNSQSQIDDFQTDYPGCTVIGGKVEIKNTDITNLNGLNVITTIEGYLKLENNPSLTDLTGLSNLTSIGEYLRIEKDSALTNLDGLNSLETIGDDFRMRYNPELENIDGLSSLTSIGGRFLFRESKVSSFSPLDDLTHIGGDFLIKEHHLLTSLAGLDNLENLGGYLSISENNSLMTLADFSQLESVGGSMFIAEHPVLTSLSGLESIENVGGHLLIELNEIITSLAGLDGLTSIADSLIILNNNLLDDISSIDDLNLDSINNLVIIGNPGLSVCDYPNICNYLSFGNPSNISGNALGCNDETEVEAACLVATEDLVGENTISIFPNPANNSITISNDNGIMIEKVRIYNQIGQLVLQVKTANNAIDISNLHHGIYILEAELNNQRLFKKMIIE